MTGKKPKSPPKFRPRAAPTGALTNSERGERGSGSKGTFAKGPKSANSSNPSGGGGGVHRDKRGRFA